MDETLHGKEKSSSFLKSFFLNSNESAQACLALIEPFFSKWSPLQSVVKHSLPVATDVV